MTGLHLSGGLALPANFATLRAAIVARSGGGKSYTAAVLAEEMVDAGQPFYVLDPTGAWWGLRASADGLHAGLPAIVIGGEHGDVPLDPAGGAAVADLVAGDPGFYVIDMSDLGTRAAEVRWATAFMDRLYRAKAKNRARLHGFWDEADLFAPQRSGPDEARMLGAAETVVRRGRIRGLGTTLITQRPAVLNKNVLSQIDVLIALKLGAPQDRKAIKEWLEGTSDAVRVREVMDSLASLALGEAWVYAPAEDPPLYECTQVRERRTFNSSATPDGEAQEPVELATVDLEALRERLAAQIEKAKADDPKALRARIKKLEQDLAHAGDGDAEEAYAMAHERVGELEAEVQRLGAALRAAATDTDTLRETLQAIADQAYTAGTARYAIVEALDDAPAVPSSVPRPMPARTSAAPVAVPGIASTHAPAGNSRPDDGRGSTQTGGARETLNAPRQRILDTIAWFEAIGVMTPKRGAVAPLAGTTGTSSGFEKNLSGLRSAGLVEYPDAGRLALTDAGRAVATAPAGAPTSAELQAAVLSKLNAPRQAILRALIDVFPRALDREALAERAGTSPSSSGFEKNVSGLRTLELIDYPAPGQVVALPVLFVGEAPS